MKLWIITKPKQRTNEETTNAVLPSSSEVCYFLYCHHREQPWPTAILGQREGTGKKLRAGRNNWVVSLWVGSRCRPFLPSEIGAGCHRCDEREARIGLAPVEIKDSLDEKAEFQFVMCRGAKWQKSGTFQNSSALTFWFGMLALSWHFSKIIF